MCNAEVCESNLAMAKEAAGGKALWWPSGVPGASGYESGSSSGGGCECGLA
jgi:hypothetical protein